MTNEDKQALIEDCKREIAHFKRCIEAYPDAPVLKSDLMRQEIALAALTAQPVKLTDCDFAAVSHMSGGAEDYCNGFVDGTQNAIKAIRAAGYEVQE